jgi:hypothetical protein
LLEYLLIKEPIIVQRVLAPEHANLLLRNGGAASGLHHYVSELFPGGEGFTSGYLIEQFENCVDLIF